MLSQLTYLCGLSDFIQVLVPILKIYLSLVPATFALVKSDEIGRNGPFGATIFTLSPFLSPLDLGELLLCCYTGVCQGSNSFVEQTGHNTTYYLDRS